MLCKKIYGVSGSAWYTAVSLMAGIETAAIACMNEVGG